MSNHRQEVTTHINLGPLQTKPRIRHRRPITTAIRRARHSNKFRIRRHRHVIHTIRLRGDTRTIRVRQDSTIATTVRHLRRHALTRVRLHRIITTTIRPFRPQRFTSLPRVHSTTIETIRFRSTLHFMTQGTSIIISIRVLGTMDLRYKVYGDSMCALILIITFIFHGTTNHGGHGHRREGRTNREPRVFASSSRSSPPSRLPSS